MSVLVHAAGAALTTMPETGSSAVFEDATVNVTLRASVSASDTMNGIAPVVPLTGRITSEKAGTTGGWFVPVTVIATEPIALSPW